MQILIFLEWLKVWSIILQRLFALVNWYYCFLTFCEYYQGISTRYRLTLEYYLTHEILSVLPVINRKKKRMKHENQNILLSEMISHGISKEIFGNSSNFESESGGKELCDTDTLFLAEEEFLLTCFSTTFDQELNLDTFHCRSTLESMGVPSWRPTLRQKRSPERCCWCVLETV